MPKHGWISLCVIMWSMTWPNPTLANGCDVLGIGNFSVQDGKLVLCRNYVEGAKGIFVFNEQEDTWDTVGTMAVPSHLDKLCFPQDDLSVNRDGIHRFKLEIILRGKDPIHQYLVVRDNQTKQKWQSPFEIFRPSDIQVRIENATYDLNEKYLAFRHPKVWFQFSTHEGCGTPYIGFLDISTGKWEVVADAEAFVEVENFWVLGKRTYNNEELRIYKKGSRGEHLSFTSKNSPLLDDSIVDLFQWDGSLWIASSKGIYRWNLSEGSFDTYPSETVMYKSVPIHVSRQLQPEDKMGTLKAGTVVSTLSLQDGFTIAFLPKPIRGWVKKDSVIPSHRPGMVSLGPPWHYKLPTVIYSRPDHEGSVIGKAVPNTSTHVAVKKRQKHGSEEWLEVEIVEAVVEGTSLQGKILPRIRTSFPLLFP